MSLGGGEMGLKGEGHRWILNVQSLTLLHVCDQRFLEDRIETEEGTYRILGKKRTRETALARAGDMGESSSLLREQPLC